jgi:hypothetical protein
MFSLPSQPKVLVEPFAGGGIISLTAAFEHLADSVIMVELDDQIAAVWQTILAGDAQCPSQAPHCKLVLNNSERKQPIRAMDWLQKCKDVAQRIGANPPFPAANAINEIESNDVRLLVKLIESGIHEQSIVGEEVGIGGEGASEEIPVGKKFLTANLTEPFRKTNFFGIEIPFGPLIHTWTDLELVAARPVNDVRSELTFKGGPNSIWKIEYKWPNAPASL